MRDWVNRRQRVAATFPSIVRPSLALGGRDRVSCDGLARVSRLLGAALGLPGLLAGAVAGSATAALVLLRSAASVNPKRARNGQL